MLEGAFHPYGTRDEDHYGGPVSTELVELANRLAWEHADDLGDSFCLEDDPDHPVTIATPEDRIRLESELHFAIRSTVYTAVLRAAKELRGCNGTH